MHLVSSGFLDIASKNQKNGIEVKSFNDQIEKEELVG